MNILHVCVMTIPPPLHQMLSIKGNVLLSSRLAVIHCDNATSVITGTLYPATVSCRQVKGFSQRVSCLPVFGLASVNGVVRMRCHVW